MNDVVNEYVVVNTHAHPACKTHTERAGAVPAWATDTTSVYRTDLACCCNAGYTCKDPEVSEDVSGAKTYYRNEWMKVLAQTTAAT